MTRSALHLVIHGRVQGVGYRWWATQEARALGLSGWVRNRRDGAVELLAIGPEAACRLLAQACLQGPEGADVSRVDAVPGEDDGSRGFVQRPTA